MKSQVVSMDLMVAVLILLIIIGAAGVLLTAYLNFEQQQSENRDLEIKGQAAINSLTNSPGNPPNWEENTQP